MNLSAEEYRNSLPQLGKKQRRKKPKAAKPFCVPESMIVNACIRWLHVHGCDVIRNNTAAFRNRYTRKDGSAGASFVRTGKKGSGDILACSPTGRWIEVECKRIDGVQEPHQVERQKRIESLGGIYILARSQDDLEARKTWLLT